MAEDDLLETAPVDIYDKKQISADMLNVVGSPGFAELEPEDALIQLKESVAPKWAQADEEAKQAFIDTAEKIRYSYGAKMPSNWVTQLKGPEITNEDSSDVAAGKWDAWAEDSKKTMNSSGLDYLMFKSDGDALIEGLAQEGKRRVLGADTNRLVDTVDRVAESAITRVSDLLGAEGASKWARDFFQENPEYDDTYVAKAATGVGSNAIQLGGIAASAITLNPAPAIAATALHTAMTGVETYRDMYDQIYKKTGSENQAVAAGIENAVGQTALESMFEVLKIGPWVKSLGKSAKISSLASHITNSTKYQKFASMIGESNLRLGKGIARAIPTEVAEESAQSIYEDIIASVNSDEAMDWGATTEKAVESGLVAIPAAALTGGAMNIAESRMQQAIQEQTKKILSESLNLQTKEAPLGLPAPGERGFELGAGTPPAYTGDISNLEKLNERDQKKTKGAAETSDIATLSLPEWSSGLALPGSMDLTSTDQNSFTLNNANKAAIGYQLEQFSKDKTKRVMKLPSGMGKAIPSEILSALDLSIDPFSPDVIQRAVLSPPNPMKAFAAQDEGYINENNERFFSDLVNRRDVLEYLLKDIPGSEKSDDGIAKDKTKILHGELAALDQARSNLVSRIKETADPKARESLVRDLSNVNQVRKKYAGMFKDEATGGLLTKREKAIREELSMLESSLLSNDITPYVETYLLEKEDMAVEAAPKKETLNSEVSVSPEGMVSVTKEQPSADFTFNGEISTASDFTSRNDIADKLVSSIKGDKNTKRKFLTREKIIPLGKYGAAIKLNGTNIQEKVPENMVPKFTTTPDVYSSSSKRGFGGGMSKDSQMKAEMKKEEFQERLLATGSGHRGGGKGPQELSRGRLKALNGPAKNLIKLLGKNSSLISEGATEALISLGVPMEIDATLINEQNIKKAEDKKSKDFNDGDTFDPISTIEQKQAEELGDIPFQKKAPGDSQKKSKNPAIISQSRKTKAKFDLALSTLKDSKDKQPKDIFSQDEGIRLMNYWYGSVAKNLPKNHQMLFGTLQNFERGEYDSLISGALKDKIQGWMGEAESGTVAGVAGTLGNQSLVLIDQGEYQNKTDGLERLAWVASHEIGHVVKENLFENAPVKQQNSVIEEFNKIMSSKMKDFDKMRAATAIRMLYGQTGVLPKEGRQFKNLSREEKAYITSFNEFFANRTREYLLNPEKRAVTSAQSLYKNIAAELKKIWDGLKGIFIQAPKLNKWLDSVFDGGLNSPGGLTEAPEALETAAEVQAKQEKSKIQRSSVAGVGERFETGDAEQRKFAARLEESDIPSEVLNKIDRGMYNPMDQKGMFNYFRSLMNKKTVESFASDVLNANSKLTEEERSTLAGAVLEYYSNAELEADSAGNPRIAESYAKKSAQIANYMANIGTRYGRAINAYKYLNLMTFSGFESLMNDIITQTNGRPFQLKDNPRLRKELQAAYSAMRAAKEGSTIQRFYTAKMFEVMKPEIKAPLSDALIYHAYANMLSGYKTFVVNAWGSSLGLAGDALSHVIFNKHPIETSRALYSGLMQGVSRGIDSFVSTMEGGVPPKNAISRVTLESMKFNNSAETAIDEADSLIAKGGKKYLNFVNKVLAKYPMRALHAIDAFTYNLGHEVNAHLAALEEARAEGDTSPLANRIYKKLYNDSESIKRAKDQARSEWKTLGGSQALNPDIQQFVNKTWNELTPQQQERQIALRAWEILDSKRGDKINEAADRYGAMINYTQDNEGTLGFISEKLNSMIRGLTGAPKVAAALSFPFLGVASKIVSRSLDYTPIGIARGLKGSHLFTNQKTYDEFGNEQTVGFAPWEAQLRLKNGLLGTMTFGVVLSTALKSALDWDDEDREEPLIEVFAGGPADKDQREDWISKGYEPYTFRIGKTNIRYSEVPPLMLIFGSIGKYLDKVRWEPSKVNKSLYENFLTGLTGASGAFLDQTFLKNFANIVDVAKGDKKVDSYVSDIMKNFIPYKSLYGNLETDIGDFLGKDWSDRKDNKFGSSVLAGVPFLPLAEDLGLVDIKPALNGFGETINKGSRFFNVGQATPEWEFMSKHNLEVPSLGTRYSIYPSGVEKGYLAQTEKEREETLGRYYRDILTYDEMYKMLEISGPKIKEGVQNIMQRVSVNPEGYSREEMQKAIDAVTQRERSAAKLKILGLVN
jgi:hypothetical protein